MHPLPIKPSIYYFCPDHNVPSGGIKVIYRHVEFLRDMGFNAFVLHQKPGFMISWYTGKNVAFKYLGDPAFTLCKHDILLVGEDITPILRIVKDLACRTILFDQNWHYGFKALKSSENLTITNFKTYGIVQALTPSAVIQDILEYTMNIPTTNVSMYVDRTLHYYDKPCKTDRICYMKRKNSDTEFVAAILKERGFAARLEPLDGVSDHDFARALRTAKVYLITSMQEGYHLSALEALACGCIVLGYGGVGGLEFLHDKKNCFLVEDGDYVSLARLIEEKWPAIIADRRELRTVRHNALRTARAYSEEHVKKGLKIFFEEQLVLAR